MNRLVSLALLSTVLIGGAAAQKITRPSGGTAWTYDAGSNTLSTPAGGKVAIGTACPAGTPSGSICINGQLMTPVVVSALPAATPGNANLIQLVSNTTNCTSTGGTNPTLCVSTGAAWVPLGGGGAGPAVYPGAGIANSTGSAWGTSYQVGSGANAIPQLDGDGSLKIANSVLDGCGGSEASPCTAADNAGGITTLLNAAGTNAQGGGLVRLPAGRYNVSAAGGITMAYQGLALQGDAPGMGNDPNTTAHGTFGTRIISSANGISIGNAGARLHGTLVRDLYLEGSSTSGSYFGVGFPYQTDQPVLDDLRISNFATAVSVTSNPDAPHITNCSILGNGAGIDASTASVTYLKLYGCEISDNLGPGLLFGGGTQDASVTGNNFIRDGQKTGGSSAISCAGCYRNRFVNNTVSSAGNGTYAADGFKITGNSNLIDQNSLTENSTGAAIHLAGPASYNLIGAENIFSNNGIDIQVDSGCTGNVINVPYPGTTILDNGTATVINAPQGYGAVFPALNAAPWSTYHISITAGITAPNGVTTDAYSLVPDGVNGAHSVYMNLPPSLSPSTGGTFYFAAKVQPGATWGGWLSVSVQYGASQKLCYFNGATGAVGSCDASFTASSATSLGNGWFLYSGSSTTAGLTELVIQLASASTVTSFAGDGTGLYVWHPTFQNISTLRQPQF